MEKSWAGQAMHSTHRELNATCDLASMCHSISFTGLTASLACSRGEAGSLQPSLRVRMTHQGAHS